MWHNIFSKYSMYWPYKTTSCKEIMKCFVYGIFCCCNLWAVSFYIKIFWHHQTPPLGWAIYLPVQKWFWKQYILSFVFNSKLWWCPLFPHSTESFTQPGYLHHTAFHILVILCFLLALVCVYMFQENESMMWTLKKLVLWIGFFFNSVALSIWFRLVFVMAKITFKSCFRFCWA